MAAPRTLYEILDLRPDASEGDVEAGYQRALEVFADDSLASYALFTPDEADRARKEIQMAYAVLRHGPSRSAYDAALATATDKAAATLSFTAIWEQGASSLSDSNVGTPLAVRRPSVAPPVDSTTEGAPTPGTRTSTGRMVMIAPPVEDVPNPPETAAEGAPPAEAAPATTAAGGTSTSPAEELPPLPPAPPGEAAAPGTPSSVPVSLSPTEPPAPAASTYPTLPPTDYTLVPPAATATEAAPVNAPTAANPSSAPPAAAPAAPAAEGTPTTARAPAVPTAPAAPAAESATTTSRTPAVSAPPGASNPAGVVRFKRVRVDDDANAAQLSRAVVGVAMAPKDFDAPLELPADGEINGSVLQRLREARGIDLRTMAGVTKLGMTYLRAIEANDFGELPARVYLRGFLIQYARALRVNPERLTSGYLAFADRYRKEVR